MFWSPRSKLRTVKPAARKRPKLETGRAPGGALNYLLLAILIAATGLLVSPLMDRATGGRFPVTGYRLLVVEGGSMNPTISHGSLVLVRAVDPATIAAGDLITYREPGHGNLFITHRVVELPGAGNPGFITRGDANSSPDPKPVEATDIVGKVTRHLPYAGYLVHYLQTVAGLLLAIILPGLLIIASEIKNIIHYRAARDK